MIAMGTSDIAYAVVLGTALGVGVCLLVSLAQRWGAPSLARRIAPYIRDVTDGRGLDVAVGGRELRPTWEAIGRRLARVAGGDGALARRLRRAAWSIDTAVGAEACPSGNHVCSGQMPARMPKPT